MKYVNGWISILDFQHALDEKEEIYESKEEMIYFRLWKFGLRKELEKLNKYVFLILGIRKI